MTVLTSGGVRCRLATPAQLLLRRRGTVYLPAPAQTGIKPEAAAGVDLLETDLGPTRGRPTGPDPAGRSEFEFLDQPRHRRGRRDPASQVGRQPPAGQARQQRPPIGQLHQSAQIGPAQPRIGRGPDVCARVERARAAADLSHSLGVQPMGDLVAASSRRPGSTWRCAGRQVRS
jgi:hypothetical protein